MNINIQNVEDVIFYDPEVWRKLPDLAHLRDQWRMSKISPVLRAMGKKALLDFLKISKNTHEKALSLHFGQSVTIDRIDRNLVKNLEISISEEDFMMESDESYTGLSAYRKEDKLYITFWR
jgi:hypothetical protein